MNALRKLLFQLSLLLLAGVAQAATYRWVDEQGKVHYGDAIPQQEYGMGHQELDKQGRVRKEAPRTRLTPEERKRREAAAAEREEAKRRADEQRRHDRSLLSSYTSEEEIDLVRDRALELEALNLKGLKIRLNQAADKLAYANGQIAGHEARKEPVPKTFQQMREEAQADLARVGELIRQREQAVVELKARYEADKLRFRELRGAGLTSPAQAR